MLPDSLVTIYQRILENTPGVTEITIPASVTRMHTDYRDGALTGSYVEYLSFAEGATFIPHRAALDATKLIKVSIPSTVTKIDSEAFKGCTALLRLDLPDSITGFAQNIFTGCENLIIHCSVSSTAFQYAAQNGLMVRLTDGTQPEPLVLDAQNCSYTTNSSSNASNYINLVVKYGIQADKYPDLTKTSLRIVLPASLLVVENSITLNGTPCSEYSYKDNVLTIPVTAASGTVHFSVDPSGSSRLITQACLVFTQEGQERIDFIGAIYSDAPILTLNVGATVNTASFRVSGVAPAQSQVVLSINGVEATTVTVSKAGNYQAVLTLPDPADGKTYTISASVTVDGNTEQTQTTVTYDTATPVLESFQMYYSMHDSSMTYYNRVVDLMDPDAHKTVITFNPNYDYSFRVKVSNPSMVSTLYVTSTRNGQVKYLEAFYDEETGNFITSGKFDRSNAAYVPGELGVVFDLTYDHIDREDSIGISEMIIDDAAATMDFTGSNVELVESTDTDLNLHADLADGMEIDYEYHEMDAAQLQAYLTELGVINESEARQVRSTSSDDYKVFLELLSRYLKQYAVDTKDIYIGKTGDDGYIMVYADSTFGDKGEKVFQTWVIESSTGSIIDYALDPMSCINKSAGDISVGGIVVDASVATVKYLDKMWELDMQMTGASEYEKQQIQQTREIMTMILVSRYVIALAKVVLPAAAGPVGGILVHVGLFLLEDYLDNLEASNGNFVTAYENSVIGFVDKQILGLFKWVFKLFWIIDPSGYVYEAVETNRLSGVTATVYYQDPETGKTIKWAAEDYDQINPIITGSDGVYAWDVPEGLWQVTYELDGYETLTSEWLPVPPPQTDVNVGLVSYEAPTAQWVQVYRDSIRIEFSKYMDPETVGNLILRDGSGSEIAYTLDYSTQETGADGKVYARVFDLLFDSARLNTGEACSVELPGSVLSYAGVAVAGDVIRTTCTEEIVITAPKDVQMTYGETSVIKVSLSATDIDQLDAASLFSELVAVSAVTTKGNGQFEISLKALMPGRTAIQISLPDSNTAVVIPVSVTLNASDSLSGDLNGDGLVNDSDVSLLLWFTLFPDSYPLSGDADFNRDGMVSDLDVAYLLWHTLFPENYPI